MSRNVPVFFAAYVFACFWVSLLASAEAANSPSSLATATDVPITQVVLFSSGMGYVQRSGTLTGNATVQLSFKTEQINDLLKSLVLLDLDGGKVGAVTYGAKDPVSKTLKAFAVNITDNPTLGQLLNRLRGVPVEVDAGQKLTGKIVGVEIKKKKVGEETLDSEILTLFTDAGLVKVTLEEISTLRLLDEKLNKELQDALGVMASGLDNQRKPVSIDFTGDGKHRVVVGYLTETPIWKTSYRLVLGDTASLLQGWAIVENTSEADWTNIHLSLVSGRPISFIQDLYTPLYLPRPLVVPDLYASLRPVHYGADMAGERNREDTTSSEPELPKPPKVSADDVVATDGSVDVRSVNGRMVYSSANVAANILMDAGKQTSVKTAPVMPRAPQRPVASAATASDLGQAFEYAIKDPVTLPRQQSALLPIVAGAVDAWKVSIYNPTVHDKYPLYGLRVKNTTGVHLMGGPVTVYSGDTYAGDATIEDLQPGEQRLLSYAIDLGVESMREGANTQSEMVGVKIVKGVLYMKRKYQRTLTYTFKAKDGKERTLIVEHPVDEGWSLVAPAKPDERTDALYRFNVKLDGTAPVKLTVAEEQNTEEAFRLLDLDRDNIEIYLKQGKLSNEMRDVLQHLSLKKIEMAELRRRWQQAQQEIQTIGTEQDRIRRNMGQIEHGSDLYKRYLKKLDVQETRIDQLRLRISTLQTQENTRRAELEEYLLALELR